MKFQDDCGILDQYCKFIDMIRQSPKDEEAYKAVIQKAISSGILSDYLSRNATEVINMFLAEYDYETDISVKCEDAREEGRETGREEKAVEAAVALIQEYNEKPETAAKVMGAPLDKVLEALK